MMVKLNILRLRANARLRPKVYVEYDCPFFLALEPLRVGKLYTADDFLEKLQIIIQKLRENSSTKNKIAPPRQISLARKKPTK